MKSVFIFRSDSDNQCTIGVSLVWEQVMNMPKSSILNIVYVSTIKNMAMVWIFDVYG
jgi:hypothetical protein